MKKQAQELGGGDLDKIVGKLLLTDGRLENVLVELQIEAAAYQVEMQLLTEMDFAFCPGCGTWKYGISDELCEECHDDVQ